MNRHGWLFCGVVMATAVFVALAVAYPRDGTVAGADEDVARWVSASTPAAVEWVARPFTWLGGLLVLPLLTLVVASLLWRRRERADAVFLVAVLVLVNVLVWMFKLGFDRPRPDAGSAISLPGSPSFPSGHAASGLAVLGALGLVAAAHLDSSRWRPALIGGGLALGVAVGASRVVLGVHYVSDVLAGYCVGVAVLCSALLWHDPGGAPSERVGTIPP